MSASAPHCRNVCLRRCIIHTFTHSWWRPLARTNYSTAIHRR